MVNGQSKVREVCEAFVASMPTEWNSTRNLASLARQFRPNQTVVINTYRLAKFLGEARKAGRVEKKQVTGRWNACTLWRRARKRHAKQVTLC